MVNADQETLDPAVRRCPKSQYSRDNSLSSLELQHCSQILYTVNCAILGQKDAFSIRIDSDEQVFELKNRIKALQSRTLSSFDVTDFRLYKADIPVSDYAAVMKSVYQKIVEYKEDQRLQNPLSKLSAVFGGTAPLVGLLHILVECLGGESFDSS